MCCQCYFMLTFHIMDVCIKSKTHMRTHMKGIKKKGSLNSEALYTASVDVCLYLCVFYKVTHRLDFMQHSALRFPRVWITPPAWQPAHTHTLLLGLPVWLGFIQLSSFQLTIPVKRTEFSGTSALRETLTHTHRELSESLPLQMQHLWLWLLTIRTLCVGVCVQTELNCVNHKLSLHISEFASQAQGRKK